ncbi:hypothetical protein AAY473_028002, partial [Plecturocebus cupreus]
MEESMDAASFLVVLFQEIVIATPAFNNHHPDQSAVINIRGRPSASKNIMTYHSIQQRKGEIVPFGIRAKSVGNLNNPRGHYCSRSKKTSVRFHCVQQIFNLGKGVMHCRKIYCKPIKIGQAQWLTPIIPALWEAEAGGSQGQEIETILVNMRRGIAPLPGLKCSDCNMSWAQWLTPVIPALLEAEAGGSRGQEIETILANMNARELSDEQFQKLLKKINMRSHYIGQADLELLGSGDPPSLSSQSTGITGLSHHIWPHKIFKPEPEFYYVGQAGLELLTSGDPPTSAPQSDGIMGMSH